MENIKNKMDQMRAKFIKNLKSKKGGSELVIFIVIIAVVAALGAITLPGIMNKVKAQNDGAITKIEGMDKIFDEAE